MSTDSHFRVEESQIQEILSSIKEPNARIVDGVLEKARALKGLNFEDVSILMAIDEKVALAKLFETAAFVKEQIYGRRLVMFAPLYISNLCQNECTYCAFRATNKTLKRRALRPLEIERETIALIEEGHKRVLLVAGESYPQEGFSYVLNAIDSVYRAKSNNGEIRRVNVNVAPLSLEEFDELSKRSIGTYQLFQETYHRPTYSSVHLKGMKANFDWRVTAMDRAIESGIDDVGIGVLFGLHDWKYEVLAMMQHVRHLENRFGFGPHTISVPRLEPATGSTVASSPPYPVDDTDFRKIVAILRLAVPYTGIIMSTRESAEIRRETFALGVSQISAGSRTNPGGYSTDGDLDSAQFSLGDHRNLDEVIRDVASLGYYPSFCTGCYRLGRTGADFMDLAKPGEIRHHCDPNAVSTFMEYLLDYAGPKTKEIGFKRIEEACRNMDAGPRSKAIELVAKVKGGARDVFC